MSILNELASKAKDLLTGGDFLNRKTKVYDASKNRIIVAGFNLDGVVSSSLSQQAVSKVEQGVSRGYYTFVDVWDSQTLTVNVLPTAKCNDLLELLATEQSKKKGYFSLYVSENGNIVNVYKARLISIPERQMQLEANDRQYVFGLYTTPSESLSYDSTTT